MDKVSKRSHPNHEQLESTLHSFDGIRRTPVHREGFVNVVTPEKEETITLGLVLFDTGATHSSYIAKSWVDANRTLLQPMIRQVNLKVKLGDNRTTMNITERVTLMVTFVDDNGVDHKAV